MCTVTFIPHSNSGFVLTSNRDESPQRMTIPPEIYEINGTELLFPKDVVAGGTWFGVSKLQRLICLLNGGFTAHERVAEYRHSRGIIVTDLLTTNNPITAINDYDFSGIEPFTIILVTWKYKLQLFELVWDGSISHFSEKSLVPQIWSSSSLYSNEMKNKRNLWFSDLLFQNLNPSQFEILQFHKTAGEGNKETDIIMDRGFVKTRSITQFSKSVINKMRYEDLLTGQITQHTF